MKRAALKPGKALERGSGIKRTAWKPARRKPLPPKSPRRVAEDAVRYGDTKEAVAARSGGRCEAAATVASVDPDARLCAGRLDMHEVKAAGRGGSRTNPGNVMHACRRHHDWIGARPALARSVGLLLNSWDDEPS